MSQSTTDMDSSNNAAGPSNPAVSSADQPTAAEAVDTMAGQASVSNGNSLEHAITAPKKSLSSQSTRSQRPPSDGVSTPTAPNGSSLRKSDSPPSTQAEQPPQQQQQQQQQQMQQSMTEPPPVTDPEGRYIRQAFIAKGASKKVYRALDEDEGLEVAWNEIETSTASDFYKLEREIALLREMRHDNIIRCFGSWTDEDRRCIVFITELMTSGTLADFIGTQSKKRLPKKVMVKYCRQILSGIDYLHRRGVIHRDLKASNIFINGNRGEVKVGDLGLSIANRTANSVIGTPEYMAPEMYDENYTNAVDVWSFGMVMIEMATGKKPYHECENVAQIFKKVTNGILPSPDIDDEEVLAVIRACHNLDYEKRPSAEELINYDLFAVQEDPEATREPAEETRIPEMQEIRADLEPGALDHSATLIETLDVTARPSESREGSADNDENDDSTSVTFETMTVGQTTQIIEWLRSAPDFVKADALRFAHGKRWIDSSRMADMMPGGLPSHGSTTSLSSTVGTVASPQAQGQAVQQQQQQQLLSNAPGGLHTSALEQPVTHGSFGSASSAGNQSPSRSSKPQPATTAASGGSGSASVASGQMSRPDSSNNIDMQQQQSQSFSSPVDRRPQGSSTPPPISLPATSNVVHRDPNQPIAPGRESPNHSSQGTLPARQPSQGSSQVGTPKLGPISSEAGTSNGTNATVPPLEEEGKASTSQGNRSPTLQADIENLLSDTPPQMQLPAPIAKPGGTNSPNTAGPSGSFPTQPASESSSQQPAWGNASAQQTGTSTPTVSQQQPLSGSGEQQQQQNGSGEQKEPEEDAETKRRRARDAEEKLLAEMSKKFLAPSGSSTKLDSLQYDSPMPSGAPTFANGNPEGDNASPPAPPPQTTAQA